MGVGRAAKEWGAERNWGVRPDIGWERARVELWRECPRTRVRLGHAANTSLRPSDSPGFARLSSSTPQVGAQLGKGREAVPGHCQSWGSELGVAGDGALCRAWPVAEPRTPLPAEMVATQQQMSDAQLTLEQRDYCAHYLIRLLKCKRDSFPNFLACKHEQHDWDYCEHLE